MRVCGVVLTYLNGWDRVSVLVAQRTNLQVKLSLQVTCRVNSQNSENSIHMNKREAIRKYDVDA